MSSKLTLVLGGVRSGKSSFAEKLASQAGQRVLFVATAEAGDEEMAARIATHQAARPAHWRTLEVPAGIGPAVRSELAQRPADIVLLDCLTLLVSNCILAGMGTRSSVEEPEIDEAVARSSLASELDSMLRAILTGDADWIIVSNEVGLGLVPPYPLGRVYRDQLGWANQQLAAAADQTIMMIVGIPVDLGAIRLP